MSTHTRRTSNYTIRVTEGASADLLAEIASLLPNVADIGETTVSFRAAGDAAALDIARAATRFPVWFEAHLTTGLGVHRRVVA